MENKPQIKIAIPATGRLAEESLQWLARYIVNREWADQAVESIRNVKKLDSEQVAREAVLRRWESGLEGITLKYDLRSGWRVAFSAYEMDIERPTILDPNTPIPRTAVTIYGSDFPTVSGIMDGLAELAVIGFDELLATMLPYLDLKKFRRKQSWENLNDSISPPYSTDVRVVSPVAIPNVAGLFLIADREFTPDGNYKRDIAKGKRPVYVKGRYQGLVYFFLGEKTDVRPTEEIEEAIKEKGCYGFDIVRTGQTVIENGLKLLGEPLLKTRPMLTTDITKYRSDEGLRNFTNYLSSSKRFGMNFYLITSHDWEIGLEERLGNAWMR